VSLYSVDFHEIEACQASGDWGKSADILSDAAIRLEKGGADFIIICTNTMHKVADLIQSRVGIPIIHIAEPTIRQLKDRGLKKVGLLGTKYTMQQAFYKSKVLESGIDVIIPDDADIEAVNSIIFQELCLGAISESSKQVYLDIISDLVSKGAEGIILGCTEIGMLVKQTDTSIPLFDTALIHAEHAALFAIGDQR